MRACESVCVGARGRVCSGHCHLSLKLMRELASSAGIRLDELVFDHPSRVKKFTDENPRKRQKPIVLANFCQTVIPRTSARRFAC